MVITWSCGVGRPASSTVHRAAAVRGPARTSRRRATRTLLDVTAETRCSAMGFASRSRPAEGEFGFDGVEQGGQRAVEVGDAVVHECGSSTLTTASPMLPSGAELENPRLADRSAPVIGGCPLTAGIGGSPVPAAKHGDGSHLDDARERLLSHDGQGAGLFDPHTIAHRPMLAFSGNSADVVQWQNISFPS